MISLTSAGVDYLKANNKENKPKGILTSDGVHLNKLGHKLVAEEMLKVFGVKLIEATPTTTLGPKNK